MKRSIPLVLVLLLVLSGSFAQTLSSLSHMLNKNSLIGNKDLINKPIDLTKHAGGGVPDVKQDIRDQIDNWADAAAFSKNNEVIIKNELNALQSSSVFAPSLTGTGNEKMMAYILLALKPQSDLTTYFTNYSITDAKDKALIQQSIKVIKDVIISLDNPTVSVFASGDVVGSIATQTSPGTGQQTTIGTGSLGVKFVSLKNIFLAKISVASTADTLKSAFGQSLLNPGKGKGGSAIIEWYHKTSLSKIGSPYIHAYSSVATAVWGIDTGNGGSKYRSTSILGCGVLLNWPIFVGRVADTDVGLNIEGGLAYRYFGGDVRSMVKGGNDSLSFLKVFPTTKNHFLAPEFGLSINVGQITAALQTYYFFSKKDLSVDGLTGLQFSFGISINASVFSGILNK